MKEKKVKMRLSSGICFALGLTVLLLLIQSGNLKYMNRKTYFIYFYWLQSFHWVGFVALIFLGEMNIHEFDQHRVSSIPLLCASAAVFDPNAVAWKPSIIASEMSSFRYVLCGAFFLHLCFDGQYRWPLCWIYEIGALGLVGRS